MNKTSFTKIFLFFFLLVGLEKINASSSTNLRKRKATTTTTSFINALSSILMKEDWDCCDGTNEPTPVTVDVPTSSSTIPTPTTTSRPTSYPTSSSTSPTLSVTSTPTTLRPTSYPTFNPTSNPTTTTSPTYMEKKLTASDGVAEDNFGYSCSMSNERIVVGGKWQNTGGKAYLYNLNGNEVSKLTPGDDESDYGYDVFGRSVSVDEKVVVGPYWANYVRLFSLEGDYERTIRCDDCYTFGKAVATYGERFVTYGSGSGISAGLYIYTTQGQLLKTIGFAGTNDVDISDEAIVGTTEAKTIVHSNTAPDFEEMAEIPQGGRVVATSGDRVVIGDFITNNLDGAAWLYKTDGTFIRTLEHDSQRFGWSVDITDDNIIVGAYGDDDIGTNAGSVFIYSATTGDFKYKVLAPDGEGDDFFGSCVSATDSYFVVGAYGEDDNGSRSGAAYMFPLSD